ncbi:MAG TPA: ABC transporter substrate-binding protein [Chloroflexota bacterium]|nr:ABC transporter substrate-binding protein [Chloroflexota bacterium]
MLASLLALACAPAGGAPAPAAPAAPASAPSAPSAAAPAAPTAAAPEHLKVIYSSLSGSYMPLWIAVDQGLFRQQGLDPELVLIESGTTATQTLVAGEAPLANVGAAAVIGAMVGGFDGLYVQATVQVPPLALFTQPNLNAPDGLRGARVGVTRFGSSTDVVGRRLLRRWDLDPERDVAMLQLGGVPELLAGLQSGAVDAAVLSDPTSLAAAKLGFRQAADGATLNIPYMHLGTVVPRGVLASRPDLIRRYLLAYQAGLDRFFADAALGEKVLGDYTRTDDPEILAGTYKAYAEKYITRDVLPRPDTLATILATVSDPRAKEIAPESLIDDTLVRELQAEGRIPPSR